MNDPFRVALVGLGYFSRFYLAAWKAVPTAHLVGSCDRDPEELAAPTVADFVTLDTDFDRLLETTDPDHVDDIVAPPPAHAALIWSAMAPDRTIICQKPFCTSIDEAMSVIAKAEASNTGPYGPSLSGTV